MTLRDPDLVKSQAARRFKNEASGSAPDELVKLAIRRLDRHSRLDDGDEGFVRDTLDATSRHGIGADLGDDGDGACRLLLSGWACRVSTTPWGGRQILDFVLPGDFVGLSLHPRVDGLYRVISLGRSTTIDARRLRDRLRLDPAARPALQRACLQEERTTAARMVQHTGRLGGPSAAQAMAHLLLELRGRLADIGLLDGERFPMPLSQEHLHEALGITVTQVYRVLSQMRRDRLILLGPGWAEICNPSAFAAAAGLKPCGE
jgi:CRP-like cAMP-binding protein